MANKFDGRMWGQIRQVTARDKNLFYQLAKTGMASVEQSEKYSDVKLTRLKKLQRSGYIKLTTQTNGGKETTVIQLEVEGKNFLKNNMLYGEKLAASNMGHINHDLQLTEAYYKLPSEYQRSFKCERELINKIEREKPYLRGKLPTCIDGAIRINGEIIGIEVIGKTYSQQVISSKIEIARNYLNCSKIQWINNTGKTYNFNN